MPGGTLFHKAELLCPEMFVAAMPRERSLEAFEALKSRIKRGLSAEFSIGHATLEACLNEECEPELVPGHERMHAR